MASSTLITDYLGKGLAANRPASPPVASGAIAFYYATDTGVLSSWNGTAWQAAGSVSQIVTGAGLSGGTIAASGTISADWHAGAVSALGSHLTLNAGTIDAVNAFQAGVVTALGAGITLTTGTLTAGGSGGTVTQIVAGAGLQGGTIAASGTISANWNGGTVSALGPHLSLSAGTLDATASNNFQVGTVTALGGNLSLTSGTLSAAATALQWTAGTVTALGSNLTLTSGTLAAAGGGALSPIGAGHLLANTGTASAVAADSTLSALLDVALGSAQGDIVYRSGTGWTVLAPGASGQVLQSGGAGANPSWLTRTLSGENDVYVNTPTAGDRLVYSGGIWVNGRDPYVIAGFVPGTLSGSQVLVAHKFAQAVTFQANFATSKSGGASGASALTLPAGSVALTVQKCVAGSDPSVAGNWTTVGSIAFAAGGHSGTFASSGGAAVSFASGDKIQILNQSSADTTFGNIALTLAGDR